MRKMIISCAVLFALFCAVPALALWEPEYDIETLEIPGFTIEVPSGWKHEDRTTDDYSAVVLYCDSQGIYPETYLFIRVYEFHSLFTDESTAQWFKAYSEAKAFENYKGWNLYVNEWPAVTWSARTVFIGEERDVYALSITHGRYAVDIIGSSSTLDEYQINKIVRILGDSLVYSAYPKIDYSALSYYDLIALRNEIDVAIAKSSGDASFILPSGVYEVGADIAPGKWCFMCTGDFAIIFVYNSYDDYKSGDSASAFMLDPGKSCNVHIEDGQYVELNGSDISVSYGYKITYG